MNKIYIIIIIVVFLLIPLFVFNLCKTYRENFPQTSNLNVLYTDQNGNLGATSDLGIDKLTVNSESQIRGNQTIKGTQYVDGIIYTNGKRNWGGGIRTWDVYASGTIATGDENGNIKASISNNGAISSPTITTINTTLSSLQSQITSLQSQITTINNSLTSEITNLKNRLNARFPDNYTLDLTGGRIVQTGNYFHMTGPNSKGSKEVAAQNFIHWSGW